MKTFIILAYGINLEISINSKGLNKEKSTKHDKSTYKQGLFFRPGLYSPVQNGRPQCRTNAPMPQRGWFKEVR